MATRGKRREREAAPRRHPRTALAAAACLVVALALYWISLRHPLVFDDRLLREDFLKLYGASWFRFDLRWLSYSTFGWTYDVLGRQWPWHRLVSVLLHATTAALLFSFLARLFAAVLAPPAGGGRIEPRWMAFFGALMFLVHPAAVYGVAYLAQRPIVMATLFGVLCLRLFLEGLLTRSRSWYYTAAVAYFAAVFSKEHAVMLPAVALALAVLMRGNPREWARELAGPLAVFAGIALLVTLKAKGLIGAPYEPAAQALLGQLQESSASPDTSDAWLRSVVNQGHLFFRYLLTWLVPYPGWMSVDLRTAFPAHALAWPHVAGFAAWLALPVLSVMLLRQGGARGLLGFALLYPWLLALTELAVVRVQEPYVLYRSYLWMSGLPCALPVLLRRVPSRAGFTGLISPASCWLAATTSPCSPTIRGGPPSGLVCPPPEPAASSCTAWRRDCAERSPEPWACRNPRRCCISGLDVGRSASSAASDGTWCTCGAGWPKKVFNRAGCMSTAAC